ncbi:MAG TPA: T9SS type A sorting domain-containing protein [Draconibacterium sp.]|nr:T9SS type A sorting domain-containing protein [Draconibacterium sp.]
MSKFYTLLCLLILVVLSSNAQIKEFKESVKIPNPVCYSSGKVEKARIPPPKDFLLKSGEQPKCSIEVDYFGFTPEAKAAFQHAVDIWETMVKSEIPIRMKATWSDKLATDVLGSCGPETYYKNFKDAPYKDRYYPVAIAEKIANRELNGESRYDMIANFSSKINWYFGNDLETLDDKHDFITVVLHEIAHGLGFTGFFFVDEDDGLGAYGYYNFGDATSFDVLVGREATATIQLLDTAHYANLSTELKDALQSRKLYATSPIAMKRNDGNKPRLYAPLPFDDGSSIYHLRDITYPNGTINSLMTHAIGLGEAIHDPGPLTLGIMDDIGWSNIFIRFDQVKDTEELKPLVFNGWFESDYDVKAGSPRVIYSLDDFESHSDTIVLADVLGDGMYSAIYIPEDTAKNISYYIEVQDTMDRKRTAPALAPKEYYSIHIGEDNENPVISHEEIPYFILTEDQQQVVAIVDDNLGIDTVYVNYFVNGNEQTAFPLSWDYGNHYSGNFPFQVNTLKDGDEITYAIFAVDGSKNQNSTRLPEGNDLFSFRIEEIFEPVSSYRNNFDQETPDFILYDFDVYTASGFANGALHSLHPYLAPKIDNAELDFSTFLKKPIILKDGGSMTFDEVVLVEPGAANSIYGESDFYDYVIVEGSKDLGTTWQPLADGYDSSDQPTWLTNYNGGIPKDEQDSETEGTSEWFVHRAITFTDNDFFVAGDTVLVRFRIYSDPYAAGWGWAIDNLKIQTPVSSDLTLLSPGEINVYPNPFSNNVTVQISNVQHESQIQVELYNALGQKIYATEVMGVIGEYSEEINLSGYRSGMFLIKVSQNGQTVLTKKLIKN